MKCYSTANSRRMCWVKVASFALLSLVEPCTELTELWFSEFRAEDILPLKCTGKAVINHERESHFGESSQTNYLRLWTFIDSDLEVAQRQFSIFIEIRQKVIIIIGWSSFPTVHKLPFALSSVYYSIPFVWTTKNHQRSLISTRVQLFLVRLSLIFYLLMVVLILSNR